MIARNVTDPTFIPGVPVAVFNRPYWSGGGIPGGFIPNHPYDVALDGEKFLMIKEDTAANPESGPRRMVLVQGWFLSRMYARRVSPLRV